MKERTKLALVILIFLVAYYVPWNHAIIQQSGLEAFMMLQEYAREHFLTCLIPAFFIAGAIAVFVSQAAVLIFRCCCKEDALVFSGFSFRNGTGSVFLYGSSSFCWNLYTGCRHWSSNSLSLFGSSHQCPGYYSDCTSSGLGTGTSPCHWRSSLRYIHWAADGLFLPKG